MATDDVNALLVEPGDATVLAAALNRALTDQPLADRLRHAGQVRADDFSMTTLAEMYLTRYRQLAADNPGRRSQRASMSPWRRRLERMMGR